MTDQHFTLFDTAIGICGIEWGPRGINGLQLPMGSDEKTRARTANAALRVGLIESRLGRKEEGIAAFQMARDGYQMLAADFPTLPAYR